MKSICLGSLVIATIGMLSIASEDRPNLRTLRSADSGLNLYEFLGAEDPAKREIVERMLAHSNIKTPNSAERAAQELIGIRIRARESFRVNDLFRLSVAIPGFANPGELVWRVQLVSTEEASPYGVVKEVWVNAMNGKAVDIFKLLSS
jgi:hypothetical protein